MPQVYPTEKKNKSFSFECTACFSKAFLHKTLDTTGVGCLSYVGRISVSASLSLLPVAIYIRIMAVCIFPNRVPSDRFYPEAPSESRSLSAPDLAAGHTEVEAWIRATLQLTTIKCFPSPCPLLSWYSSCASVNVNNDITTYCPRGALWPLPSTGVSLC